MKVKDIIKMLKHDYKPDDVILCDIWQIDDVMNQGKDNNVTEVEAVEIIARMEDSPDACIGINWDVIQCYIDEIVAEREDNHEEDAYIES